ncbi:hypothetical protein [uncultured Clostridium sp.]|uniref:hypothetical protein n=1 Tax=uncultured Clostridium sp. TaxID=59620 RepID=UPI002630949F|nr:hypothetical protein [uncultured Clostridium sp.]
MKKKIIIIGVIVVIGIFLIWLKMYNPNGKSNLVTSNITKLQGYNSDFTVLPAIILEEIFNEDQDFNKIQSQINQITDTNLKSSLQANLNQYKLNELEYVKNLPFDKTQEYTKNIFNNKNILPFNGGSFLPFSPLGVVKDGKRYYVTVAYVVYSSTKNQSLDNNNKDIYGISVFNIYDNGELQPLYISSK